MKRRGQVETPVVMIFAVGAGILILTLISYFVLRQQSSATDAASLEALAEVRDSLASLQGSVGVTQELTFAGAPYTARCEDLNGGELFFTSESGDEVSLRGLLVATPESINSDSVTVATGAAGTVFRIGTMVYVMPQGHSITVPATAPKLLVTTATDSLSTNIVHTKPDGSTVDIAFNELSNTVTIDGETLTYIDDSLLTAAAVTADPDLYACVMDRYIQLLAFNNRVQQERIEALKINSGTKASCLALYDTVPFTDISTALTDSSVPELYSARSLPTPNAPLIELALKQVSEQNGKLLRGDRCATVS